MIRKTSEVSISSYKVDNDWLISPATYLVDSYVPYVERIFLHETSTAAGKVTFKLVDGISSSKLKARFFRKFLTSLKSHYKLGNDIVFIDLRDSSPQNISHAIMMFLPLVLLAETHFDEYLRNKKLLLVFPTITPSYISNLFELLGYNLLITDSKINGTFIDYNDDPWLQFRGVLTQVLKSGITNNTFRSLITKSAKKLPHKIFISRKDTRKLTNEHDVEVLLKSKGYQKVYAEDYSVLEQIALVSHANSIVAIHGAALGLMAFRALFDLPPIKLLEIFPPSHMTNVYRILTRQLGGAWVGVRGKVWSKLLKYAYPNAKSGSIRKYSLSNFEVCEKSLLEALARLDKGN